MNYKILRLNKCTRGGTRTRTISLSPDFESDASTNSATRAKLYQKSNIQQSELLVQSGIGKNFRKWQGYNFSIRLPSVTLQLC